MMKLSLLLFFALIMSCSSKFSFEQLKVDPSFFMNTSQVIQYRNYPCENHNVQTKDGYILSLQRIPYGVKNKTRGHRPVAFLQHGLVDSSFTWVNNAPNESLGFILADAGFDVWLSNSRGNDYSDKHIKYTTDDDEFWDFSFDEMAQYDLPASIDYVLNVTGAKKLSYVGHSQGTLIGFIQFSKDQSVQNGFINKISSFSALAPVVYLGNLQSAIKYLSFFSGGIGKFLDVFGHGAFEFNSKLTEYLAELICGSSATRFLCKDIMFLLAGYDPSNLNMTRLPVYVVHCPAGTSVKNMLHFVQGYRYDKFQMFDYGFINNLRYYGHFNPPQYNLDTHNIPLGMYWGGADKLADPGDVAHAIRLLGRNVYHQLYLEKYDHMDFIWGMNAANDLYKDVIQFMKKYM